MSTSSKVLFLLLAIALSPLAYSDVQSKKIRRLQYTIKKQNNEIKSLKLKGNKSNPVNKRQQYNSPDSIPRHGYIERLEIAYP